MKLRSVLFTVVLLLLTVTVCAAKSSMGFSPTEFYEAFDLLNTAFGGPECIYTKGSEEGEAYILNSDTLGIYMECSGSKVTELYFYYKYLSGDEDASAEASKMLFATLATFWGISKAQSGADGDDIDLEDATNEIGAAYFLLLMSSVSSEPQDYWGYSFYWNTKEANGYEEGVIHVEKAN